MNSIPKNLQELLRMLQEAAEKEEEWEHFRLPNGQLVRISFSYKDGSGLRYGLRSARVRLETPKAEKAAIAALVALKGKQVEARRLRYSAMLRSLLTKPEAIGWAFPNASSKEVCARSTTADVDRPRRVVPPAGCRSSTSTTIGSPLADGNSTRRFILSSFWREE
jgi:hypothetical protein